MKTKLIFMLVAFFATTISAQTWNGATRDAAYVAPSSKLMKKWYKENDKSSTYEFASGSKFYFKRYDGEVTYVMPGTWKRDKDNLILDYGQMRADIRADVSARHRDDLKAALKPQIEKFNREYGGIREYYKIFLIDDEYLILADYNHKTGIVNDLSPTTYFSDYHVKKQAQLAKEREEAEAKAKLEAEAKAKRAAEEKARLEAERKARLQAAENEYWNKLGAEKKASVERAAAEGVKLVDLGLSVRWASANIGAKNEKGECEYFAWGETETKKGFTKKKYKKPAKNYTEGMVLDPSDDAATKRWGTGWHIPTPAQWEELRQKCTLEEVRDDKFWGFKVTGPNGNFIYLPFNRGIMGAEKSVGALFGSALVGLATMGFVGGGPAGAEPRMDAGAARYWTNTSSSTKNQAVCYGVSARTGNNIISKESDVVFYGLPIRAVME